MAYSTFSHAGIKGISVIVPEHEIRLEDEARYFGGSLKKVERAKKMLGLGARRYADREVTAADLCQQAAENLFEGMNIDRSSIDALIFISQGPDHAIPATACILQNKLGLPNDCAAFDVNQGCSGYIYGLWMSFSMLEARACKRILLLVGEVGAIRNDPDNRVLTPIFGDAGSATLIDFTEDAAQSYFLLGTDGSGAEALMIPMGAARCPISENLDEIADILPAVHDEFGNPWYLYKTYMNGGEIFNFTLKTVPPHILAILEKSRHSVDQIDYFVLHQANRQIMQAIAAKAGLPMEKVPVETVARYGNQSGCSVPAVICDQLCPKAADNKLAVLLCGYGVGLSWGSAILDLDHVWCSGIREFVNPGNLPTREEFIAYWRDKIKNAKS